MRGYIAHKRAEWLVQQSRGTQTVADEGEEGAEGAKQERGREKEDDDFGYGYFGVEPTS